MLLKDLEKSKRNFLWTGNIEKRKLITVSRKQCCLPYKDGGLGIKSLITLNKGFLKRFTWKFLSSENFAFHYMRTRYLKELSIPRLQYISSLIWSGIKSHYFSLLGDIRWILGWNSIGQPLYQLAGSCIQIDQLISDFYIDSSWNIPFLLPSEIRDAISKTIFVESSKDYFVWPLSKTGDLTSKEAYSSIHNKGSKVP
ncbi:hypothetical protein Ddye_000297 [Dipteronia dyeriana]|uniref:Uncharacterized protein n=1 Tax=Dipteronia dyeriana TaxID=168575 RepID=A0AAE0CSY7_9ROSI|nr:hypothetical protein Ddye_000297 [Dipteronia dyeriana]